MNILVENNTARVVHITDGPISLESDQAVTPESIYSMFNNDNATVYTGETPPTTDGGRYTYDGTTFTDTWPYKNLSRVDFLDALQEDGGVSDSDLVSSRDDTNLAAFWMKFGLSDLVSVGDARVQAGLDALVTLGYLTNSGKQSVIDNWPRGE